MIANTSTYKDIAKYFRDTFVIVPEVSPNTVMRVYDAKPEGIIMSDSRDGRKGLISFEDGFGTLSKMAIVYNDKGQTIDTYQFTKKQAIAVGARLNTSMLMKVVNRLVGMCELYLTINELYKEMQEFDLFIDSANEIKIAKASDHISVYYTVSKKQLLTITE